ncbi:hypothetical protein MMC25_000353 [Agyrium rufum]|nr:hypothetical protein [Agyrium rufum]
MSKGSTSSRKTSGAPANNICAAEIKVNNNPPSAAELKKAGDLPIIDKDNNTIPFRSLYSGEDSSRRTVVLFVRHFFCGYCQIYLRNLCASITPSYLASLPTPTKLVIIGCGEPKFIPFYAKETNCPFPMYCDPTAKLYRILGMTRTLGLGNHRPKYQTDPFITVVVKSFLQGVSYLGRGALSAGDYSQVGGEFLVEDGKVVWCHRMRNTRDHAEIDDVMAQLDGSGAAAADETADAQSKKDSGVEVRGDEAGERELKQQRRKTWTMGLTDSSLGRRLSRRRQSSSRSPARGSGKEERLLTPRKSDEEVKKTAMKDVTEEDPALATSS